MFDKAKRAITESSSGGAEDDGEQLHLREGRVAFIGSHCMRIKHFRLPCTLLYKGGRAGQAKDLDVESYVSIVNDAEVPPRNDI